MLEHKDSRYTHILIEPRMNTTFADGELVLNYERDGVLYEMRHDIDNLRNWTFTTTAGSDGLWASIADADNGVDIEWVDGRITVRNAVAGTRMALIAIDGRLLKTVVASGNECSMDLTGVAGGIYVITIKDKSFKIAVKR